MSILHDNSERQVLLLAYSTEREHIVFSHLNEAYEGQTSATRSAAPCWLDSVQGSEYPEYRHWAKVPVLIIDPGQLLTPATPCPYSRPIESMKVNPRR